jgi:hypothetical protein
MFLSSLIHVDDISTQGGPFHDGQCIEQWDLHGAPQEGNGVAWDDL